jgi:hypothetical protein
VLVDLLKVVEIWFGSPTFDGVPFPSRKRREREIPTISALQFQ